MTDHLIQHHRHANPRTTALKIIRAAGFEPWPRLFQNLRSSFETELTTRFPLHVACQWSGNTEAVALSHYLQVTSAHFDEALRAPGAARSSRSIGGRGARTAIVPQWRGSRLLNRSAVGLPPTTANRKYAREMSGFLRALEKRASRALQQLKNDLPKMRASDIGRLKREVARAKRRTGGRHAL